MLSLLKKSVVVASLSTVCGLLTVVDARSASAVGTEDDCACKVVNKAYVVGDCKCDLPGGGGKVKAVSISVPVFVGGQP